MPLTAKTNSGARVFAPELGDKNQEFFCPFCNAQMSFVDAEVRIKHFRHLVKSQCSYEPETEEHENYKYAVYKSLKAAGIGNVFIEHPVEKLIADVYLERTEKPDIAFEIQATNYNIAKYEAKIAYYAFRNILVVYIFIGDAFCNEVRPNIYSLKEIEKRIFDEKKYNHTVIGCYMNEYTITKPLFYRKYSKGGDGFCSNRFIMSYDGTKKMKIDEYIKYVNNFVVALRYFPNCIHGESTFEKHNGKITRYKEVCEVCKKFIKWLPNNEARNLGLDI